VPSPALERGVEGKNDEEVKKEVIDLSLAYSLSSRYTTFVAVEERQEATEGTMQRRTVPLNGFGYRQPAGGARGGRGRGGFGRADGRGGGPPQRGDRSCASLSSFNSSRFRWPWLMCPSSSSPVSSLWTRQAR
jgi:hypothetical protein